MKTYLKIKRAIRYLFYKHISVEDQLKVKEQFNNDDLTRLFWQLSMQDRHHSIEVLERTINKTLDDEILSLKELESLNDLYTLCLLHDIGKSGWWYVGLQIVPSLMPNVFPFQFIAIMALFVFIYFMALEGEEDNSYGPSTLQK